MKKIMLVLPLLLTVHLTLAQYTKEKITTLLTNQSEKSWNVSGINTERPEKLISFNINNSVRTEQTNGIKKTEKWSLKSTDNIRWFLSVGKLYYELIISYDKKGNQYIKLTHQVTDKSLGYYEIKLTPAK